MSKFRQLVRELLALNVYHPHKYALTVRDAYALALKLGEPDDRPLYLAGKEYRGAGNRWKRRAGWRLVERPRCSCWYQGWDCDHGEGSPSHWYEPDTIEQVMQVVRF
jgi:hypothetical protein